MGVGVFVELCNKLFVFVYGIRLCFLIREKNFRFVLFKGSLKFFELEKIMLQPEAIISLFLFINSSSFW